MSIAPLAKMIELIVILSEDIRLDVSSGLDRGSTPKAMQEQEPSREQLLLEIARLRQEVEELKREKADLEILLDTTTEHSDLMTAELHNQALETVRASERRLRQFLEAIPVGVAVLDASGKPYYTNRAAKQLLGQGIEPLATVQELPEVYQIYLAGTDQIYRYDRLPVAQALQGEIAMADDLEIRRGEQILPIEAWGTPIFDEQGQVTYAIVVFQDITERKLAEMERQKLIQKLSELNHNLEKALDAELEITDAYGRFVPHQFLHLLGYESIVDVRLGDHVQQEMSVFFADIRDFTRLSENMTPADNFQFINAYLSRMEPAITAHNGFIDKYIGDAIMALFGGIADDAVQAGITMLKSLAEYNMTRGRPGRPKMQIGIGINTGLLMLGTVGGQNRMEGTVISDAVNLSSRIEGLTKEYGVQLLISQHTLDRLVLPSEYAIRMIDQVQVKGKSELVTVYEVFDADPPEMLEGKLASLTMYQEAISLYHQKAFKQAKKLFTECWEKNPADRVVSIYLKRCRDWRLLLEI